MRMRAYALQSVAQRQTFVLVNQKNISTPYYRNEGEAPRVANFEPDACMIENPLEVRSGLWPLRFQLALLFLYLTCPRADPPTDHRSPYLTLHAFRQFARHQKLRREIDQVLITVEFETLLIFLCQTVRI